VRVLKLPVFGVVWILCAASGCASSHKVPGARTDMEHEIEGLQKQAATQAQSDPVYKITPGNIHHGWPAASSPAQRQPARVV
jgi:hypothetical protein